MLRDSRMSKRRTLCTDEQVHKVFLVGGSSHIPKIEQLLTNFFDGARA